MFKNYYLNYQYIYSKHKIILNGLIEKLKQVFFLYSKKSLLYVTDINQILNNVIAYPYTANNIVSIYTQLYINIYLFIYLFTQTIHKVNTDWHSLYSFCSSEQRYRTHAQKVHIKFSINIYIYITFFIIYLKIYKNRNSKKCSVFSTL